METLEWQRKSLLHSGIKDMYWSLKQKVCEFASLQYGQAHLLIAHNYVGLRKPA